MARFVNFSGSVLDDFRRIISNGYTREARSLLRGQGAEHLTTPEKIRAMLRSKIHVSTFEIPATHKVSSLSKAVNTGACDLVEATETQDFLTKVAKMYGYEKVSNPPVDIPRKNFYINKAGEEIGYFTMQCSDDAIRVGNFAIVPEQRGSKTVMEALISLRDKVLSYAKETGATKIKAEVDVNKPELLTLYKRLGFEPVSKIEIEGPMGISLRGQYLLQANI